jgi:mevalonate kinase
MQITDHIQTFSARGKFLITAEYAVLDNVTALAVPLKLQQYLKVMPRTDDKVSWKSYDDDGSLWFSIETDFDKLFGDFVYDDPIASKLAQILRKATELNPGALSSNGFNATTHLDFNRHSGMGTSSTLISLVSQWLDCNPYVLQFTCFGGSGYDIACATATQAITYNYNDAIPIVKPADFNPLIKEDLFFVYLNKKQNSRDSIARFDSTQLTDATRETLNEMPAQFQIAGSHLESWDALVEKHESLIGGLVGLSPAKDRLFPDFNGAIKSLGGWGGDFVLASGGMEERGYFMAKGYTTILEWDAVIL